MDLFVGEYIFLFFNLIQFMNVNVYIILSEVVLRYILYRTLILTFTVLESRATSRFLVQDNYKDNTCIILLQEMGNI